MGFTRPVRWGDGAAGNNWLMWVSEVLTQGAEARRGWGSSHSPLSPRLHERFNQTITCAS